MLSITSTNFCSPKTNLHQQCEVLGGQQQKTHSRLRLGGVVSQGNRLPLDLVETFLAEVVPVSNKPKFW